jgi:hypothetical protein
MPRLYREGIVTTNGQEQNRDAKNGRNPGAAIGQRSLSLAIHCSGNNRNNNRMLCFISEMLAFVKNFAPFEITFHSL